MAVYDCFMFHNEVDMAILRMYELRNVVDYHVICESYETHSGLLKETMYSDFLMARLPNWLQEKVILVQVDSLSGDGRDSWQREAYHRSCISYGLDGLEPDDLVIVSDCDEIVRPDVVPLIKDKAGLTLDLYYYTLNNRVKQFWGIGASRWGVYQDVNGIRTNAMGGNQIDKAGWHLSYFGDEAFIAEKLKSFMHHDIAQQYNVNEARIKHALKHNLDLYGRGEIEFEYVPTGAHLPAYVLDNLDKYRAMGWVE